mgnify:CR=1 FL=1
MENTAQISIKNGKIVGTATHGEDRGGAAKVHRSHEKFLKAWRRAGCPENFRTDGAGKRILDKAAMQEKQRYLEASPETRKILDDLAEVRWAKKQNFLNAYFGNK